MGSNFDRGGGGSNFNRRVNIQHVGGHYITTPAKERSLFNVEK